MDDKEFVEELERREQLYLNGTAKMYTAAESAARAKEALKQVKNNK